MNIKEFLRKVPCLVSFKRQVQSTIGNAAYKDLMATLRSGEGQEKLVAEALDRLRRPLIRNDAEWVEKIENERATLKARKELLVDGSLGEGGLYDEKVTVEMACNVSKRIRPALMLYHLVRATKPAKVLELGTNVGISSAYLAAALKENGKGALVTCDASPYRQRIAKEVHSNLGLDNVTYVNGIFTESLAPTIKVMGGVDFAFIDGHHQYQPTLDYFREIYESAEPNSIFVFDDIRWSDGMIQAWRELQNDHRLQTVIDLTSVGIGVGKGQGQQKFVSRRAWVF